MLRGVLTVVIVLSGVLSCAQSSEVSFIIKNFGVNVDGHFNRFDIKIDQGADGKITDIKGTVLVQTIETGISTRDDHIMNEDYFDALNYPEIKLESTSIVVLGHSEYKVSANLEIKGIVKPITFKGALIEDESGMRFQTQFEINRRDFNVGGGGVLGKTVVVKVIYYPES